MASAKASNCSHGQALSFKRTIAYMFNSWKGMREREFTFFGSLKKKSFLKKRAVLYFTEILFIIVYYYYHI